MSDGTQKKFTYSAFAKLLVLLALAFVLLLMQPSPRCSHSVGRRSDIKAATEMRGAELALSEILADAGVVDLRDLFTDPDTLDKSTVEETMEAQSAACYDLLRHGKNARIGLKPEIRSKLTPAYMDLSDDPWSHPYRFYLGPLGGSVNTYIFRCYRGDDYVYDQAAYEEANKLFRGNPKPDAETPPAEGYPCPGDLPVYIFSCGRNGRPDQLPWGGNGGDDINNWDPSAGWSELY